MSDALKELRDIALDRKESEKRSLNGVAFAAGDVWKDEHNGCWIANIEEVGTGNNHVAAQAVSRDIDEAERRRDVMLAALAAPASPLPEGGGWQDISTAPKDGTPILAWCVHPHARWAGDDRDWAAPVVTSWTTHNGGGWTWHGMIGTFTHWMPLPAAPTGDAK